MPDHWYIYQVVQNNDRCNQRNQNTEVKGECHKRLLFPHEAAGTQGLPQPGTLPPHLLPQELLPGCRNNS